MVYMNENFNIITLVDQLKKDGYLVLREYYDQKYINILKDLILLHKKIIADPLYKETIAPVGNQNILKNDETLNNLPFYDLNFLNAATQGLHLDIIGYFLNDPYYGLIPEDENNFILAQSNARNNLNALPFHVDVRLKTPGTQTWSMQTLLSLDSLSENNGSLIVRKYSHLNDKMPKMKFNYVDYENIETSPGDLIIFYSKLDHATSHNKNKQSSWSILNTYRSWWAKPQYNFHNMIKKEYINKISVQQFYLLGGCSIPSSNPISTSSMRHGYNKLFEND